MPRNAPRSRSRQLLIMALVASLGGCGGAPKAKNGKGTTLPPLAVDPFAGLAPLGKDAPQAFTFRRSPKAPPSSTKTVALPFPATQKSKLAAKVAKTMPKGPLKVLRIQPKGKSKTVGAVTVSFDQPMVPVASLSALKGLAVPLRLEPEPKGRWRWLGTRTVAFEPEGRLAYSTEYKVTVPAGTKSALGAALEAAVEQRFTTPRPAIVRALPSRYGRQTRPDAVLALQFNQAVELKSLLARLGVEPGSLRGQDFEVVPKERWAKLRDVGVAVATWDPRRTVVLRPKRPLAKATSYRISIAPGLRGEGPRTSRTTLRHHFRTYGPLKVDYLRCGTYRGCDPAAGFYGRLSNPLVSQDIAPFVTVTPDPGKLNLHVRGRWVYIKANYAPRTRYTVRIAKSRDGKGPVDIHDQVLARPATKTFTTGDRKPQLSFPVRGLAALERSGKRLVPLEVTNVRRSRLRMVKVAPEQIFKVIAKARYTWHRKGRPDPLTGIKGIKVRRALHTGIKRNGKGRIGISTDEALGKGGSGPVYIELRSEELRPPAFRWANPFRGIVVQVTDMALMARYGNDRIAGLLTHMQHGKAIAEAKIALRDAKGVVIWSGKSDAKGWFEAPGRRSLGKAHKAPFVLWAHKGDDKVFLILDQSGDDGAYLSTYARWGRVPPKKVLRLHLFSDRSPYRPGQVVQLKGIVRVVDLRPAGGVQAAPPALSKVKVEVKTSRGHKIHEAEVEVRKSGTFSLKVSIPSGADLGHYRVYVTPLEGPHRKRLQGSFRVEAYRPPEFKVQVEAPQGPHFVGQTVGAKVGADYLFGAPMRGAKVRWTLTRQVSRFSPPKNPGFRFGEPASYRSAWRYGRSRLRYRHGRRSGYGWRQRSADSDMVASGKGTLDATGRLGVEVKLARDVKDKGLGALGFTLEAQVIDKNRQAIANRKVVVAHAAGRYIGLRSNKQVLRAGESLDLQAVVVDLEGKRLVGESLEVKALKVETKISTVFREGRWTYDYKSKERFVGSCKLRTADKPVSCALKLPEAGSYLLRAETADDKGRKTRSALRVYAYGPGYVPWRLSNQDKLELVADKASYEVGDVAKVLIKSPLRRGLGMLAILRGGIEEVRRLEVEGSAHVLKIPIKAHHLPGVHVAVALGRPRINDTKLGKAVKDLGRPRFAHGRLRLAVAPKTKRLAVVLRPIQKVLRPSQTLELEVETKDASGKAVSAELAVMLVDEGVLSLLGYQTPDPVSVFWANRGLGAPLADIRNILLGKQRKLKVNVGRRASKRSLHRRMRRRQRGALLDAFKARGDSAGLGLVGVGRGGGGSSGYGGVGLLPRGSRFKAAEAPMAQPATGEDRDIRLAGQPITPIRSRSKFATTAYYNPSVVTDARGRARLKIEMPDNLTTFRIMAVAVDRGTVDRFGKGEAQVKVRKPLLLRPSLPRFLSVGDRFEAAVMVHNNTKTAGPVDVLVRGRNARSTGVARRRVVISAGGSKEVRFPMAVAHAGPARVQFAAVLGKDVDAVEKQVPVLLPATTEAFATYGMTDKSVAQPVAPPKDALAGYGGLDVSMSSTALNGLEDSVRYLVEYPWECTEQTASRVIPIFALKDILGDFGIAKLEDEKRRRALAARGVRKLEGYQRWDGGWGYWRGSRQSWLYISSYAALALLEGKARGQEVTAYKLRRAKLFLKRRLDNPHWAERRDWVGQTAAVWVLSRMKQHEKGHLSRLYALRRKLPIFARAWLMTALYRSEGKSRRVSALLREIDNAAVQTASAARFAEGQTESLRLLMHSNDRTDAIVLAALLEVAPEHALMPKIARGLLQSRVRGRWSTTQANAYALMALSRYYEKVEKVVPKHVSQIWYGDGFMGEGTFAGREMKSIKQTIPLAALNKLGKRQLVLAKRGQGKLYYRIGLRYAPKDLVLPPEEQGFSVSRSYEAIRDPKGVLQRDTVKRRDDGSWEIKAGSTVRVRVVVVVPDRRFFVAVVDPLPAGLEGINLGLQTSARQRLARRLDNRTYHSWSWYSLFAFDHREIRDDRVVLFADRLPAGVYEYTYLARATSFGSFVVAPAKAEEMYRPETFGRSGTTWVHVR